MLLVTCSIIGLAQTLPNPVVPKLPELSELAQLKAENLKLRQSLLSCRIEEAQYSGSVEQKDIDQKKSLLIEEFRKELKANEKDTFNWDNLTFSPAK
jgi:hypothetical protein